MTPVTRLLTVTTVTLGLAALSARAADPNEDKAKEAAVTFLKAVKAKDLDGVMKAVDTPFLMEGDKGEPRVIEKADELRTEFKGALDRLDAAKVPTALGRVVPAAKLREAFKDKVGTKEMEAVEKAIGKDGFLIEGRGDKQDTVAVMIAIKDGKARVVGVAD